MEQIKIYQRNTFDLKITCKVENDQGVLVPKNLLGYTVNFIVKNKCDNLDNDSKSLLNKNIILNDTDAENGTFYIHLTAEETNIKETKRGNTKEDTTEYLAQIEIKNDSEKQVIEQFDLLVFNNLKGYL